MSNTCIRDEKEKNAVLRCFVALCLNDIEEKKCYSRFIMETESKGFLRLTFILLGTGGCWSFLWNSGSEFYDTLLHFINLPRWVYVASQYSHL